MVSDIKFIAISVEQDFLSLPEIISTLAKITAAFQIYGGKCITILEKRSKNLVLFIKIKSKKHLWKSKDQKIFSFIKGMNTLVKIVIINLFRTSEIDKGSHQRTQHYWKKWLNFSKDSEAGGFPLFRAAWKPWTSSFVTLLAVKTIILADPGERRTGLKLLQDPILRESSQSDLHSSSLKISIFMNSFYLSKT